MDHDNSNNVNHHQQQQQQQQHHGFTSVYSNMEQQQQPQPQQQLTHVHDLDNAFSRMNLYNGGSVFSNNGTNNGNGNNVNGDDQLYDRMLLRSAMNRTDQITTTAANNTTPFYGSVSPYLQNGYGSSSSSNQLMDQYNRFSSMNTPFLPPLPPPPPADPYHHLLNANALFFQPRNGSAAFDRRFSRNDQFFDSPRHFNHHEIRSYTNGWSRGRINRMTMMNGDHQSHNQFEEEDQQQQHQLYYSNNMSFDDLRGKLVNYAMEQRGCMTIQRMLEKMGREEFNILFDEVICDITALMMDQYGNFIFQKLVEGCSADQRTQIVVAIARDPITLFDICLNSYGTRAVQKLLMCLTTREQKGVIVMAVSHKVFELSKNGNGHHVVAHCIKNFPYDLNQVFLDQLLHCCFELSTDQSGCCVVQACVDHSRGEGRDRLVREIISVAHLLSEDGYGNYVVQCLLRQTDQTIKIKVWEKLKGYFTSLSCNKFGSNVVEVCLEQFDRRFVDLIIMEMLQNPHVSSLFSDPFGNYVTQVALSNSKGAVHEALVREIQKHAPSLQSNQYGKMTLSWFDPKKRRRSMKNRNKYGQYGNFHHP